MGTFRFLLAMLVMLSHFPGAYMKGNYGASAVLAFYFISGWLMAMSYRRFQERSGTPVSAFFVDRFIKLWPSYMLVFLVSLAFFSATGVFQFDWRRVPLEVLILPNAFSKLIPWNEVHALTIVPPAWSLGVEACFYLTVPLLALLTYRTKVRFAYLLAIGHVVVLMVGAPIGRLVQCGGIIRESLCTIPISDYFGMDFPVLVGVTFLLGNIAYERFLDRSKSDNHLAVIWGGYLAMFLVISPAVGTITNLATYEVLLSMSFFLPAALAALELTRRSKPPSWDKVLGELSYPLFLTHFLMRYIVEWATGMTLDQHPAVFLLAIGLSIITAIVVMYFQRLVDRVRYGIRGFAAAPRGAQAAGIA